MQSFSKKRALVPTFPELWKKTKVTKSDRYFLQWLSLYSHWNPHRPITSQLEILLFLPKCVTKPTEDYSVKTSRPYSKQINTANLDSVMAQLFECHLDESSHHCSHSTHTHVSLRLFMEGLCNFKPRLSHLYISLSHTLINTHTHTASRLNKLCSLKKHGPWVI